VRSVAQAVTQPARARTQEQAEAPRPQPVLRSPARVSVPSGSARLEARPCVTVCVVSRAAPA
jgi:hypothetical protein